LSAGSGIRTLLFHLGIHTYFGNNFCGRNSLTERLYGFRLLERFNMH
jgi:hypothetical protein